MASALANVVVVAHFTFLVFLVLGGFMAWRWPWLFVAHLAVVTWGIAIVVFSWLCPLTSLENWLRERAGRPALADGFIDTYVTGVIYPGDRISEVRVAVGVVVAASWLGLVARRRGTTFASPR